MFVHHIDATGARHFALRGAVSAPIKEVHLPELGIDSAGFLSRIAPTFHELPFDPYDPALSAERLVRTRTPAVYAAHEQPWLSIWNDLPDLQYTHVSPGPQFWAEFVPDDLQQTLATIRPHRRRSSFQYRAEQRSARYTWDISELGSPAFTQAVSDVRSRPRRFAPPPPNVYRDPDMLLLVAMICQLITQTPSVIESTFKVTLHQMLTYAYSSTGNEPAPEGTHQDGSPFILSALVIERRNVVGGLSSVYYTPNGDLALQCELQPGQGILQSDTHHAYWHSVSAIYPRDPSLPSYRSIIGLDIDFGLSAH